MNAPVQPNIVPRGATPRPPLQPEARHVRRAGHCAGAIGSLLQACRRQDLGRGRRIRLRQVDACPPRHHDRAADRRRSDHRRQTGASGPDAEPRTAPHRADRVPGPLWLAQSAPEGRHHSRRAAAPQHLTLRVGAAGQGAGDDGAGRPPARALRPLSAHVLGRPAPAHRHRPFADAQPEDPGARRAGVGARRLHSGSGAEPA